jgi:hypothetical protein
MGTLTGQQINNTYDGLLKLSDSTTGITSTLQAIEDGLGNNTGARIATNLFTAPNVMGMYQQTTKPDFMGIGYAAGSVNLGAGAQTNMVFGYFYDPGVHDYSAITINVTTGTAADTLNWYFYDLQFVTAYGYFPRNLIMSGITPNVTSIAQVTTALPSTLSFSGYGGGYFAYLVTVRNSGIAPAVRFGASVISITNQSLGNGLGFSRNAAGTALIQGNRNYGINTVAMNWFTGDPQPSFTAAECITKANATTTTGQIGFGLNVIK